MPGGTKNAPNISTIKPLLPDQDLKNVGCPEKIPALAAHREAVEARSASIDSVKW
jgi:hypothetical protein